MRKLYLLFYFHVSRVLPAQLSFSSSSLLGELSFIQIANGTTEEVKKIVTTLNEATVPGEDVVEVVVSPPYVFLPLVKDILRPDFHAAAQNSWVRKGGAFTGEISAEILVNLEVPWVILGHSELRQLLNESNENSNAFVKRVRDEDIENEEQTNQLSNTNGETSTNNLKV
ncbi:unnamed protein product [Lupinus luteus]|uniref:Triosephosphate isomerase n=1 Tax=Lupinus luteus TaxID=3873 RepID=A0AAV1WKR7_LUPLU